MSMQVLEHSREPLGKYLTRRSANIAIERNGFIEVPAQQEFLQPLLMRVAAGMDFLIKHPERWKHFPWQIMETDGYGENYAQDIGFRPPEENKRGERKFTFHYLDSMVPLFASRGVPIHEYSDFLGALRQLSHYGMVIAMAVAEAFDNANRRAGSEKYPGSLADRLRRGRFVIRILQYLEQHQEVLAQDLPDASEHLDRGVFSPHFWSSEKGLYLFGPDRERHEAEETSFSAVTVFPGKKFAAATRGKFGYGTVHGVRDHRRGGIRNSDRIAIVGFAHPIALPGDVDWLLANKQAMEAWEKSFRKQPSA